MNAIIINSAPGVGKSTLLKLLSRKLPHGFALIDGDDVGRVVPLQNSLKWLNLIQDNIIECIKNYKKYGSRNVVISFVFPSQERLQRLINKLTDLDYNTFLIALYSDNNELEKRIIKRNTTKVMDVKRSIECNNKIKELNANHLIDTSYKDAEQVAEITYRIILSLIDRG